MVVKHGRYGKFLACSGFPECSNTKPYVEKVGVKCPECGGEMVVRHTRKGKKFYGCSNYPECKYSSWQKLLPYNCPVCSAFLVQRRSKSRGTYYACSREGCDFTVDSLAELDSDEKASQAADDGGRV
jgi:DNA topoisomerase-1